MPRISSLPPSSSYRVQLTPSLNLKACEDLLDYLDLLSVGSLYLSPVFEARPGSEHGYDVTDPTMIREDFGGQDAFDALCDEVSKRGIKIILDVVPNHMSASPHNRRWMDVLADGAASPWGHWFDIDWRSPGRPGALETHVLLPILGRPYGSILEDGELRVVFEQGAFFVDYYSWRLPLSPRSWPLILEPGLGVMAARLGMEHPALTRLYALIEIVSGLPPWTATDPDSIAARQRGVREAKELLKGAVDEEAEVREHLESNLSAINGEVGEPASFDRLDSLLRIQPYRLCFWKISTERVSYRRFFDIGSLIGVRVEDRRVFRETHEFVIKLVREGKVHGLRLDHIDGLLDPLGYLKRLRRAVGKKTYIVAEKILASGEELPADWPVNGTTGYDILHVISGPFVDKRGLARLSRSYDAILGVRSSFRDLVHRSKIMVLETLFGGEVQSLISDMVLAAQRDRHGRDISPRQLGDALIEVSAALSVYRTYLLGNQMSSIDLDRIKAAIAFARTKNPKVDKHAFDMVFRVLSLDFGHRLSPAGRRVWRRVVQRWQQLTGPAMAKGLEDTALYIDSRFIALNEVGADEETIENPTDVPRFHAFMSARQKSWPNSMVAGSTHDSKRSEDVRARLFVLSEMAREWDRMVGRWSRWHRSLERSYRGRRVPDPATASFVYQTLLGVWPPGSPVSVELVRRVQDYLRKAAREAKLNTSWIDPDEGYEEALMGFVEDLCNDRFAPDFNLQMRDFSYRVAFFGAINSLAITQLRMTVPGMPDIYQGNELWRFDLADPDNRRPVDFSMRKRILEEMDREESLGRQALLSGLLQGWEDGRVKLYLLSRILRHRRANGRFWSEAEYMPLNVAGRRRENILAFARRHRDRWVISLVPRLATRLVQVGSFPLGESVWGSTVVCLPPEAPSAFTNTLTGESVQGDRGRRSIDLRLSEVLKTFPTSILESA